MSRRKLRRDSCTGKRRFESFEAARETLQRWFPDRDAMHVLNAYQCVFCRGAWHIGHRPSVYRVRGARAERRLVK